MYDYALYFFTSKGITKSQWLEEYSLDEILYVAISDVKQKARDYLTMAQIAAIPALMQTREGTEQVKKIMNHLQQVAGVEKEEPEQHKTIEEFKNRLSIFNNVKIKKKGGR